MKADYPKKNKNKKKDTKMLERIKLSHLLNKAQDIFVLVAGLTQEPFGASLSSRGSRNPRRLICKVEPSPLVSNLINLPSVLFPATMECDWLLRRIPLSAGEVIGSHTRYLFLVVTLMALYRVTLIHRRRLDCKL
jgi:hypothetical protein